MRNRSSIFLLLVILVCSIWMGCNKLDPSPYKSRIRVWTDLDTNVYGLKFYLNVLLDGTSIGTIQTNYEKPCDNCDHLDGEYYSKSQVNNKCLVRNISLGQHTITGIMKGYTISPVIFTVKEGDCLPIKISISNKTDSAVGKASFWGISSSRITNSLKVQLDYNYSFYKILVPTNNPVSTCDSPNALNYNLFEGLYSYYVYDTTVKSYNYGYIQSGSISVIGGQCTLVEIK